ncbi:arylsulfotransferase family protein, partial [Vibrio parahaemolyticus]
DAYHVNAIEVEPGNRLLISARDTSAVYLVNRANGHIDWTLGGKRSSFTLRSGTRFWFQHDARMLAPDR